MAAVKFSIVIAVICVLLQCVDSRSVLGSLRKSGLSKGKLGKLNGLKGELSTKGLDTLPLPTVDVSGLKEKITLPSLEINKIKHSIRKPILGGKFEKRHSLKSKLARIASLKKSFLKKKLANISAKKLEVKLGKTGKLSEKLNLKKFGKLENGKSSKLGLKRLSSIFGRRLFPTPKLSVDGKLISQKLNKSSKGIKFGNVGLFKKTLRQRLADKLGLENRFNFFDGRRGIFDRTGSIFGKKKSLNPIDMLDGKLASLSARFQKKLNRINKKIARLNLSPVDMEILNEKLDEKLSKVNGTIADFGEKLGQVNRKLSIDIGSIGSGKLNMKFNPLDELDEKLASLSSNGIFKRNGRLFKNGKLDIKLNPLDLLEGKLAFLKSQLGLGNKLFDGKLFNKKSFKLNPIDLFDGKLVNAKFGSGLKNNLIDELDSKIASLKSRIQKPISLGWNGKLDDVLPSLDEKVSDIGSTLNEKMADVEGAVDSIVESAFAGKVRSLENAGETRFQRLWKRERSGKVANMLAAKLALKKRLFERISKLGKGSSKFGGKFVQKLKTHKTAKLARLADTKVAGKFAKIGQLDVFGARKSRPAGKFAPIEKLSKIKADEDSPINISLDKLFEKKASTISTAAPGVTSTTTVSPAASTEDVVSSLLEKVSSGTSSGSTRNSDAIDNIPGASGILYAVNLLENGGSLQEATSALVERNDVHALKHLFESINAASGISVNV